MEAPLSSPSLNKASQTQSAYFTSSSSNNYSTASSSAQSSAPSFVAKQPQSQQPYQAQYQGQSQQYQSQQYQSTQSSQQTRVPQQNQMQGADGTSPFLRDFNLVAEAAKRAQMAVLMRDMEAVGI